MLHPENAAEGLIMTSDSPNILPVLKMNEFIYFLDTRFGSSYDSRAFEIPI
jgi:hypothetical protein